MGHYWKENVMSLSFYTKEGGINRKDSFRICVSQLQKWGSYRETSTEIWQVV